MTRRILLLAVAAAGVAVWAFQAAKPVPPYYKSAAEAKPLPKTLPPAMFSEPAIAKAYRIAQEIPEVLAQQPCYCYCNRMGHKGLLDCHRDNHSAG